MIYNPLKKTRVVAESCGLQQTFTDHFNAKVKVYRFKVHTCSGVHSCCKAQASTVHAADPEPVKTLRGVHAQPDL